MRVPAAEQSASPGNLIKMQILHLHPDALTASAMLGVAQHTPQVLQVTQTHAGVRITDVQIEVNDSSNHKTAYLSKGGKEWKQDAQFFFSS